MSERLQKLLASAGLGSRREIEKWISDKRVTVNGSVAKLGDKAKLDDKILVDGRSVALQQGQLNRVLIYNKSEGEVSTTYDPEGRPIIFDRLPRLTRGRWITVGRLDINTTGLLLITNYGDLAHRLMHPSFSIEREYLVRVYGRMDASAVRRMTNGVELEDGIAKFSSIVPHNFDLEKSSLSLSNGWFRVILLEGRNREVRRLFESQGAKVSRLKRIRYGPVRLPSAVRRSNFVELKADQVKELVLSVGLKACKLPSKTSQKPDRQYKAMKEGRSKFDGRRLSRKRRQL
jgi:23S rRNA pseudouridine2605 synthase